jgi:hypothetical protein
MKIGKLESLAWSLARISACQCRQQIVVLLQCLAQRRQRRLGLSESRLLHGKVAARDRALVELTPQCIDHLAIDRNQFIGGINLFSQRRLGDGCDRYVGGQCEIGRLDLKALHVRERLKRFDFASIKTPNIERVSYLELRSNEIENAGAVCRHGRQRGGGLLSRRIRIGLHQWKEFCFLGENRLLVGSKRSQRRLQIRIIAE